MYFTVNNNILLKKICLESSGKFRRVYRKTSLFSAKSSSYISVFSALSTLQKPQDAQNNINIHAVYITVNI